MLLEFYKIHAQGNDYIYFNFLEQECIKVDYSMLAQKLSKFHFGIGGDGIVLLLPSNNYDAKMRIFNADGSEALMCGSALRACVYLLSKNSSKNEFSIRTNSGIKKGVINDKNSIIVNLGQPKYLSEETIENYKGHYVSVGNPHFVIFDKLQESIQVIGPKIENNEFFKNKVNVEWVKIISPSEIKINIWERGTGETLACGTGSAASAYVSVLKYKLNHKIKVKVPGGSVIISYINKELFLEGDVKEVFRGKISV